MKITHLLTAGLLGAISFSANAQDIISGDLSSDDMMRDERQYYEAHTVEIEEPRMLRVSLNSDEFDTYLIIKTPMGTEEYNDDAEGSDSYLELLAEPGTYTIWASSYDEGTTGSYSLGIELGDEIEIERVEGRLDPRDEQLPKGEYVDTYMQDIESSEPFSVRLKSYGFDGYLVVTSPSGTTWRNDDWEGDISVSMVTGLQPEKGEWKIQVTTLEIEEVGAYDLEIITTD